MVHKREIYLAWLTAPAKGIGVGHVSPRSRKDVSHSFTAKKACLLQSLCAASSPSSSKLLIVLHRAGTGAVDN